MVKFCNAKTQLEVGKDTNLGQKQYPNGGQKIGTCLALISTTKTATYLFYVNVLLM